MLERKALLSDYETMLQSLALSSVGYFIHRERTNTLLHASGVLTDELNLWDIDAFRALQAYVKSPPLLTDVCRLQFTTKKEKLAAAFADRYKVGGDLYITI